MERFRLLSVPPVSAGVGIEQAQAASDNEKDESLSAIAARTMQVSIGPKADDPTWIQVVGPCPNCGHDMEWWHYLVVLLPGRGPSALVYGAEMQERALEVREEYRRSGEDLESVDTTFPVSCTCHDKEHGDTVPFPDGCGVSWYLRATQGS